MPDVFVAPPKKDSNNNASDSHSHSKEKTNLNKKEFKKILLREKSLQEKPHLKKPLSAFCFYPDGINFENRESQEKIILFLRQHPIVNIPWIIVVLLMLLAPFFVSEFPLFLNVPSNFLFIFVLMWYLLVTAFTIEKFLTWFFNVYIVTDERIVDIDFYNLIYKEVSDAKIDKIQDVTYNMGGVVRALFNYGNVLIQTASEVPNFEFLAVPKPDKVARILQDLQIEEEQEALEGRVR